MKLKKEFFNRKADAVARDLLGKVLVKRINGKDVRAKIVETEAYFGEEDPASRASKGKTKTFEVMWNEGGKILVYSLHKYIMFCIVTGEKNKPEAVLIRALEPINSDLRLSGPGLLSNSLNLDKSYYGKDIFNLEDLWIEDSDIDFEIIETKRIGVKENIPLNLRFYIKSNKFVSRK